MVRLLVTLLALSVLGLSACGDEAAEDGRPASDGANSGASGLDCAALVPDAALASLGWSPEGEPEEHAGRCERRVTGSGAVTVATRAVTKEGVESARQELATQCDDLRSGGEDVEQPVAWLADGGETSCATGLAATRTGVAELYFLNDVDEVVQIRVEALTPVEQKGLEAGMTELAGAAATLAY